MKPRILYPAGFGAALAMFALCAVGQTSGSMSHATMPTGSAASGSAATSASGNSANTPAMSAHEKQATHHRAHAKHKQTAAATSGGDRESAYHTALQQCVAGPDAAKEVCLDAAIARFGRT